MEMVPMVLDMGLRIGGRWYSTGARVEMPKRDAEDYAALNYAHVDRDALIKRLEEENRFRKSKEESLAKVSVGHSEAKPAVDEVKPVVEQPKKVAPQVITKSKKNHQGGHKARR